MASGKVEPEVTRTVGVEEEFLLVGVSSGEPVPVGPDIASEAGVAGIKGEFKQEQVEICSAPTDALERVSSDLRHLRGQVSDLAGRHDAAPVASGTWPGAHTPTAGASERFDRIGAEFGELAHQQLTCGTHVHVAVASPEEGVRVLDRIRPWLALLTALASNSPFWQGRDTGHASWRSVVLSQLPTAGPAPVWGDLDAYRRASRAVIDAGGAFDEGMLYYDARLSARYPTVEVRVTDVCPEPHVAVAVAGLCRALVDTAARATAAIRRDGEPSTLALRSASWQAARHGVGDRLVDPGTGALVAAEQAFESLLRFAGDALDENGDRALVTEVVKRTLVDGTAADRQRRVVDPGSPWRGLTDFRVA